jgi:hypothetical protein
MPYGLHYEKASALDGGSFAQDRPDIFSDILLDPTSLTLRKGMQVDERHALRPMPMVISRFGWAVRLIDFNCYQFAGDDAALNFTERFV